MKKRLVLSTMTIALVASLVGGATFASWTASSSVAGNTFNTDTMSFSAVQGSVSGLYPGVPQNLTITVNNPKPYAITVNAATLDAAHVTWHQSAVTGLTPTVADLTLGALAAPVEIPPHTVAGDGTNTVTIPVTLAGDADNSYQGNYADVTFSLNATAF